MTPSQPAVTIALSAHANQQLGTSVGKCGMKKMSRKRRQELIAVSPLSRVTDKSGYSF